MMRSGPLSVSALMKICWSGVLALLLLASAPAQRLEFPDLPELRDPPATGTDPDSGAPAKDFDLEADDWEFDRETSVMTAEGAVKFKSKGVDMTCDVMTYDTLTDDIYAAGNVRIEYDGNVYNVPEIRYNLETKEGLIQRAEDPLRYFFPPTWSVLSDSTKVLDQNTIQLDKVTITTCDPDNEPNFFARAETAMVYDRELIIAKKVTWFLEDVPVFYLPRYTFDLKRQHTNYDVLPGYDSRDGFFILNAYTIYLNENLRTVSHLDYRSKRGIGIGQDFIWYDKPETNLPPEDVDLAVLPASPLDAGIEEMIDPQQKWSGQLTGYMTWDDEPYTSQDQEDRQRAQGIDIDEERHRARLSHYQALSDYDSLFVEMNYWSDQEITRDFFEREYRIMPVPENRVSLVHYDRNYSLSLEANKQLNDDLFGNVDRLPEATFTVFETPVLESPFFYESFNSAGMLERIFSKTERLAGFENYDTSRVHTQHRVSYPKKYLDFLNIIPRVGYYGTFYGDTFEQETRTETSTSTNGVVTTNTIDVISNQGGDVRNMLELGLGTSFKAFKVLHENESGFKKGLRHVIEPYADYTFIPEPDLRPANIYQFDFLDTFDRRNDIVFGLRNKLQTKELTPGVRGLDGRPIYTVTDIVDLNVFAVYQLDPEDDNAEELSDIFFDGEVRFTPWMQLDVRGQYDQEEGELAQINSQLQLRAPDYSYIAFDHVYRPDQYNIIQTAYGLFPLEKIFHCWLHPLRTRRRGSRRAGPHADHEK